MPQIQTSNGPSVATRATPTPLRKDAGYAPSNTALGIVAAATDAAKQVTQAGWAEKQRADTERVLDAEARLDQARNDLLYAPDKGFENLRGAQALTAADGVHQALQDTHGEILASLTKDQQKVFAQRTRDTVEASRVAIERHVAKQSDVVDEQTHKALEESKLALVRNAYRDDDVFLNEMEKMQGPLALRARKLGLSPEKGEEGAPSPAEAFRRQFVAKALDARMAGWADAVREGKADPAEAQKVYERWASEMGPYADKYAGMFKAQADGAAVEKWLTRTRMQYEDEQGRLDVEAARGELGNIPPEKRREYRAALEHQEALNAHTLDLRASQHLNAAEAEYAKTGKMTGPKVKAAEAWFLDEKNLHVGTWTRWQAQLARKTTKKPGGPSAREQAEDDRIAWYDYLERARTDMDTATKLDPTTEYAGASQGMRKRIAAEQAKHRQIITEGGLQTWEQAQSMAAYEARRIGMVEESANGAGKEVDRDFAEWWRNYYDEHWIQKHKAPTRKQLRKDLGEALVLGDRAGGSMFARNKRRYQVKEGEPFVAFPLEEQDSDVAREYLRQNAPAAPAPKKSAAADMSLLDEAEGAEVDVAPLTVKATGAASSRKQALIDEIRKAHKDWTPAQVTAELRRRMNGGL